MTNDTLATGAAGTGTTQDPQPITAEHRRVLSGAMVGTTIEWFDFFIYAQAAALIFAAQYFNPASNESATMAQIISWASLGISFLFRPLGAIIAGHLGDRLGRKPVLVITLVGMGGATVAMGLLPTYAQIGIAAPIILVFLRILQGLSAGGEWGGAALLAVEHAPVHRRGYFGSFPQVGVPAGMLLATLFMLVLSATLTTEQFESGAGVSRSSPPRLIVIGFIRRLSRVLVFRSWRAEEEVLRAAVPVVQGHTGKISGRPLFAGVNAAGYLAIAYIVSYGTNVVGYDRTTTLAVTAATAISWIVATLVFGALSDTLGRKQVFALGYIGSILWAIPTWLLVDTGNIALFILGMVVLGILLGSTYGPQSALYAEMFPAEVRLSGVSIGYAIGSIIGGAFAPMIAAMLLDATGTSLSIGIYIAVVSLISLIAVLNVPRGIQGKSLH